MAQAAILYSREVLALATALARWPLADDLSLTGSARSPVCGSRVELGLSLTDGQIDRVGMRVQACAIGQASAAIFATHAAGRSLGQIERTLTELEAWLDGAGGLPDWPDLAMIAAAQAYPARHGAILLPWQAAREALS